MPWTTPTLDEVRRLNRDAITARLGAGVLTPNSVLRVLADANAGLASLTLAYLDWLARQMLPDTAESEWLRRHAEIWLGGWKQATYAQGRVAATGEYGAQVPAGARIVGPDGLMFEVSAATRIGVGATDVPVVALQAGKASNVEASTTMNFADALSGVDGGVTVIDLTGGADDETDDDLRARVLDRIRKPPMGGDADDYVAWAKAFPGVTRAWCSPGEMGVGTVTVRFMMDDLRAATGGFPLADDCDALARWLDAVRPVTVKDLFVVAPLEEAVDVKVVALSPDSASIRAAVSKALGDTIRDRAAPAFARNGVRQDAQTIYAAWLYEAITHVAGVESFALGYGDHVMPSPGHVGTLGAVIYE